MNVAAYGMKMLQKCAPICVAASVVPSLLAVPQGGQAQPAPVSLEVAVTGIKYEKGVIRLAICPPETGFPDCKDKATRTASLPVENGMARTTFTGLPAGTYAVSVFHDLNGNGKLDTFVGIPKEGYGFSRNPPFRPRAPRWEEAEIVINGAEALSINLRYIL